MRDLNYNHLRYFWAVAHDGNLTRTAARLAVSQSALSTQIRKLEDRLGHPLFEREGRRLVLTEAGRIALDHADAIFATGDELLDVLRETGRARQAVRVGALATLSRNFQIGFVEPLLHRADVELVLRSGSAAELMQALASLQLDVVLANQPPARDSITPYLATRLAEQRVSLIGRASARGAGSDLASLLAQHPVILPTPESTVRTAFDSLVAALGVRPQIAAEVDDMAMMRLLARAGAGLAVLPPIVVRDELESGMLIELDQLPQITESFYAVTLERRFPHPLVGELLRAAHAAPQPA
ncbi:LysR family transcriptional regulator [Sphingomonas sp. HT-1]|uniref:LysR family transcriptional regulator n=1 Tax=unclassified Sphingomonas TaxID=196159 RepID=UPI0002E70C8D|nr:MULTISPECIES: LysR family transcriptional regulator [unclassified Sphingomonas]KTF69519.1 LysR family transcriptional regulator [Sphingomonas sp. WG]